MNQQEQELRTQVEHARGKLQGLTSDLRDVEGELESLAPQREQHELLEQACGSLEKLGEIGAASLFWGEGMETPDVSDRLREVRARVSEFRTQLDRLDEQRRAIRDQIHREEHNLGMLGEDLDIVLEEEERKKNEWIIERDISAVPPRAQRMAWQRGGEEDRRFRKSLGTSLLASLVLGAVLPMIPVPAVERFVPENMPQRLAQLVRPEQTKLVPPPPMVADNPEQAPEQQPDPAEEPPPETQDIAATEPAAADPAGPGDTDTPAGAPAKPGATVQKAGILAFRDKFASLANDDVAGRLGNDARLGNADEASAAATPTRSMLTSNAPGASGGINVASISRNVGGGGGNGGGGGGAIHGVQVGRATSAIAGIGGGGGGGGGNGDRPRARGSASASRTDEEIQIVFDRYKAAFYRLYNRELRKDPTLRGQMVLQLTIEPDGSVSMCKLQSSDMKAPDLAAQVVSRVKTINFGAKDVGALTIVYPIDFLPKS